MKLHVGTSGYSYKEWKGTFYPDRLDPKEMLGHYASRLSAVEINNTFYRLPRASVLETWAGQVPEEFRFVLKASRRITHFKRLKEAGDETGYLLKTVATLGERLGLILFQIPPYLRKDLPRLESFLELLGGERRAAFDFRHPSWLEQETVDLLRSRGLSVCITDSDQEEPTLPAQEGGVGYLRMRRSSYTEEDMSRWLERIRSCGWGEAYVFFKHEKDAPGLALRFEAISRAG